MLDNCATISLLVIGFAMLMVASSSSMPKIMSRRDLRSLGTLVIVAGAVMMGMKFCSGGRKASYRLSPAPLGPSGESTVDRDVSNALLDTSKVSLDCCFTSPYSTSTGCVCDAQAFVKSKECADGSIGPQFPASAINQSP